MCGTASRSFLNDVGTYFVLRCYSKINTDWREADRQTYQTINDHIFLSLSLSFSGDSKNSIEYRTPDRVRPSSRTQKIDAKGTVGFVIFQIPSLSLGVEQNGLREFRHLDTLCCKQFDLFEQ